MTDNETIMALKYCVEGGLCALCPLMSETFCMGLLHRSVFELINRQKAEIEGLQITNSFCHKSLTDAWKRIEEVDKLNETAKSKAIKEFAERLKKVISISDTQKPYFDNLLKEMAGDDNV